MEDGLRDLLGDPNKSRPLIAPAEAEEDWDDWEDASPQDPLALITAETFQLPEICQTLSVRHQAVLRLAAMNWKTQDIAEVMNITPTRVSMIKGSERGRIFIRHWLSTQTKTAMEAQQLMEARALGAAANLIQLANDKSVSADTRLKANNSLLDRAGLKPADRHIHEVQTILGPDDLARLRRADAIDADIQSRAAPGPIIDVPSEAP